MPGVLQNFTKRQRFIRAKSQTTITKGGRSNEKEEMYLGGQGGKNFLQKKAEQEGESFNYDKAQAWMLAKKTITNCRTCEGGVIIGGNNQGIQTAWPQDKATYCGQG